MAQCSGEVQSSPLAAVNGLTCSETVKRTAGLSTQSLPSSLAFTLRHTPTA